MDKMAADSSRRNLLTDGEVGDAPSPSQTSFAASGAAQVIKSFLILI